MLWEEPPPPPSPQQGFDSGASAGGIIWRDMSADFSVIFFCVGFSSSYVFGVPSCLRKKTI